MAEEVGGRAARAVGEMSGQPCGWLEYTTALGPDTYCGYEQDAAIHTDTRNRYFHAYTPLERRTGKDRRGGQGAADHRHVYVRRGRFADPNLPYTSETCLVCGERDKTLPAAPQAAPAAGALREALPDDSEIITVTVCRACFRGAHTQHRYGECPLYDCQCAALAAADAAPEASRRAWRKRHE